MVRSTKVNGASTKRTAKVNSGMQTEMFMKDFGKMTKQMVTVSMSMSTVPSTKVTGATISRMVPALSLGQMDLNMRAATKRA